MTIFPENKNNMEITNFQVLASSWTERTIQSIGNGTL